MKKIAILGSTGSIGKTTLDVAQHLKMDVVALTAHSNVETLSQQIEMFHPKVVALIDRKGAAIIRERFPDLEVLEGKEGICEVAALPGLDRIMMAIVGVSALAPTLSAIEAKQSIAFASKEVLVCAGSLIMNRVRSEGIEFIPVDSEHSAIFQCLLGHPMRDVSRVIITSSGGPFLYKSEKELTCVSVEEALNHPTWSMGPKVTIDSSTLMNKALELIEAYHLFNLPLEKLDVIIHPQSLVHCMVEWNDGNIFTHLHPPHMSYPIRYAMTFPERKETNALPFDFTKHGKLEFFQPDSYRFKAIALAKEALTIGKSSSCYLNAANEVLVARFLERKIAWHEIITKLETLLTRHCPYELQSLDAVLAVDEKARLEAQTI